jgi:ABC-type antimicrobial peptide transport system permease subunit
MPAAAVSFGCTIVVLVMLAVRGSADWSRSFAVTWYGLLVAATAFGLVGVVSALLPRRSAARRAVALALSLPALLTAAAVTLLLIILVNAHLN